MFQIEIYDYKIQHYKLSKMYQKFESMYTWTNENKHSNIIVILRYYISLTKQNENTKNQSQPLHKSFAPIDIL